MKLKIILREVIVNDSMLDSPLSTSQILRNNNNNNFGYFIIFKNVSLFFVLMIGFKLLAI